MCELNLDTIWLFYLTTGEGYTVLLFKCFPTTGNFLLKLILSNKIIFYLSAIRLCIVIHFLLLHV